MSDLSKRIAGLNEERRRRLASLLQQRDAKQEEVPPAVRVEQGDGFGFRLSFAQQRLWFLEQLEPGSAAYNIPVHMRLRGRLDEGILERSLAEVVQRHEPLRTSFINREGSPLQQILPAVPVAIGLLDLRGLPEEERESLVLQHMAEDASWPFDLSAAPLWGASLLRLGEEEHVLLFTLHRIIADGWSVGVLLRELALCYEALSAGRAPALPEPPIQYADYAAWQREYLQGEVWDGLVAYWREALAGAPGTLDLQTDRPRRPFEPGQVASQSVLIPMETADRLKRRGEVMQKTLFMYLLAAFDVLLYKHTGQPDVVVGSRVAGRTRSNTRRLIGPFDNLLALRTTLSDEMPFYELLWHVEQTVLGAYAHQEMPFDRLVEELQPEHDRARHPVFQVTLALEEDRIEEPRRGGLKLTTLDTPAPATKFDLEFIVRERADGLEVRAFYDDSLFDAETVVLMLGHYRKILELVYVDQSFTVAEFSMLSEEQRRLLLYEWSRAETERPDEATLPQLFEEQAARTPDAVAVAVSWYDGSLTYRELNERADRLARRLRGLGVGPETRVGGLLFGPSVGAVVALLATLKAGGAYLPLDPQCPQERLAYMLEDANANVLLTEEWYGILLPRTQAHVVFVDADEPDDGSGEAWSPAVPVQAENLAYVIYTSSSTGRPKGVMVTHRAAVSRLRWMIFEVECSAADRVLHMASLESDVSIWEIFLPLLSGACLVLLEPGLEHNPSSLRSFVAEQGVTILRLTPAALREFLRAQTLHGAEWPRVVVSSGEALPPELAREFFERGGGTLYNLYGPTEAAMDATSHKCAPSDGDADSVPIGRPFPDTYTYLLDRDLSSRWAGDHELYIGGDGLARGYLNRPGLTAERFIPDPFAVRPGARMYRTGDVAREPYGELEFLGRNDDQVKLCGFRVEPGEVEAVLRQHPSVREAVVVAREDSRGEKGLVAYVIADGDFDEVKLLESIWERLPDYMIPSTFMRLDELPLTLNGKIDRRALPEPGSVRPQEPTRFTFPRSVFEEQAANIFAQVLCLGAVGIDDNFFELGGHSLLATQIVSRVRSELGVELSLKEFFDAPTVNALALIIERKNYEGLAQRWSRPVDTPQAGWTPAVTPPPERDHGESQAAGTDAGLRRRLEELLREYEDCRRRADELESRMLYLRRLLEEVGQDIYAAGEAPTSAATPVANEEAGWQANDVSISMPPWPGAFTNAPARSLPCPNSRAAVYVAEGELTGYCARCGEPHVTVASDPFTFI